MFEEVAAARDQIDLLLARTLDDPLEGGPKILAASLCSDTIEALTREGSVEMQVSEMEKAKGHKSPVTTRILVGAMAYMRARKQRHYKGCAEFVPNHGPPWEQRLH
jgi:hypothetical protein